MSSSPSCLNQAFHGGDSFPIDGIFLVLTSNRDFKAPKPCPYDSSAAMIAARGLQMLHALLLPIDKSAAEEYLSKAFKLVGDTLGECASPRATLRGTNVNWGEGGWETLLMVSIFCQNG
jgi:hypothetical protein